MARKPARKPRKPAKPKGQARPLCKNLPRTLPQFHATVASDVRRAAAIITARSKWVNGTVLHYCFYTTGRYKVPKAQAAVIRWAFATWKAVGIGLSFKEVKKLSEAEVRIAYSVAENSSESAV